MTILDNLAGWTHENPCGWSATALERGRLAIADTLGCIIAAARDDVVQKTTAAFFRSADGHAFSVGNARTCQPSTAAVINGTAAHVLEIDDNFYPALTHASAQSVPALFALAEETGATGRDLIDGYILGLDLQAALASAMGRNHTLTGWHATGTIATIATAAVCARMLGLDRGGIANAMSIACSMAAGSKSQFGTMTKSLHCGLASRNSVVAAELAAKGIEGSADALDGDHGFLSLYSGALSPDPARIMMALRGSPAIEEFGLAPKLHACCGSAHKSLDCARDLQNSAKFDLDDVDNIDVWIGRTNRQNLKFDRPKNGYEARFSMPYAMVVVLLSGRFWLGDLEDAAVQRPEIRRHLEKIRVNVFEFDETSIALDQPVSHSIKITLRDGTELSARRAYAKGTIADPLSEEEYKQKFLDCCRGRYADHTAADLWNRMAHVEEMEQVRGLLGQDSPSPDWIEFSNSA